MSAAEPDQPQAGRPRDPRIEDAILEAARSLLVQDGYSAMSLSDVAARAGSNRPALYRRWRNKLDLIVDALRYGYSRERTAAIVTTRPDGTARERFRRAVHLLDPRVVNAHAYVLQGDVLAESERNPDLLEALQRHAVGPRCADFAAELDALRREGAIRADVDLDLLTTMCFGSFFGMFLRGGPSDADGFAERLAEGLWPLIRAVS